MNFTTSRYLIERSGVKITVRIRSAAAKELVKDAIAGLRPVKVSAGQGIRLTVKGNEGEWLLRDHSDDVVRKLTSPGDLIYHLTDRIVFHIANNAVDHCLHAAAVSYLGRALVIPANSGAGKSSFTTWLVANGFDYLTDELILVSEQQRIDGLARPIQIKANGIEAVKHLVTSVDDIHRGTLANAVPVGSLQGKQSEQLDHELGLMVFPQYKKTNGFEFKKLSAAEAGMSLMANHVNARNLEGHGFRAMMKMIRNTSCYSLEYGGFDRLPSDFADQLKSILAAHD